MSFISTGEKGEIMNYVVSIVNSKYFKAYYKTAMIFLAIRGFVDFVLYFFSETVNPIWAYGWLFVFIFAMLTITVLIADNVHEVRKYYMNKFQSVLYDKYMLVTTKDWNSKKNDFLFAVADGLHMGLSFSEINRYVKKISQKYYSLLLRKRKNAKEKDFDLILKVNESGNISKSIRFTKDTQELISIASGKIGVNIKKYLDDSNNSNGKLLLHSALFGLKWISLAKINFQINCFLWATYPNRKIEIVHFYKTDGYGDQVCLTLMDDGNEMSSVEIYKKGIVL